MNLTVRIVIGLLCANLIVVFILFYPQIDSQSKSLTSVEHSQKETKVTGVEDFEYSRNLRPKLQVEIWSKAAIGQYFLEDILQARLQKESDHYLEGTYNSDGLQILFRSGPSLKVQSLRAFSIPNLVLILNWRTREKINSTLAWLETALDKPETTNLGILALGNEQCHNSWFEHWIHAHRNGHKFRFLFIVYDWAKIDHAQYYQWPLGVATYRNFVAPKNITSLIHKPRPYICNYIGTVYPGTSRQELSQLFDKSSLLQDSCIHKTRSKWVGEESEDSMDFYVNSLTNSELTLNPIGMNHECYRIYESAAYGSIPVIEVNLKHLAKSSCDKANVFRLFHELNAPFIYVHNWTEIHSIIEQQKAKTEQEKIAERRHLIEWYARFKLIIRDRFLQVLNNQFNKL